MTVIFVFELNSFKIYLFLSNPAPKKNAICSCCKKKVRMDPVRPTFKMFYLENLNIKCSRTKFQQGQNVIRSKAPKLVLPTKAFLTIVFRCHFV